MSYSNLTPEEIADLNTLHGAAFDLLRQKCRETDTIPPMWLCMSPEAKQEAVSALLDHLSEQLGHKIDLLAAQMLCGSVPASTLTPWRMAEAEAKQARADGNPRAYFAG